MAHYLVETYLSRRGGDAVPSLVERARDAAAAMRRAGIDVRYLHPIVMPEDETCFHLFDGPSAAAVGETSRRADLVYERIVEAVEWLPADPNEGG